MSDFTETNTERVTLFEGAPGSPDDVPLQGSSYTVTTSDAAVAEAIDDGGGHWAIAGRSAGTATVSAIRNSDGAVGTDKTIEVTEVAPGAFEWHFGTAVPN